MKMRRWISTILALLLASSLPLTAFAETYDLEKGSISVTANAEGQYVSQEANDIKNHLETTTTVITHRRNIARKLEIHSATGLTIYAIVNGLVDLSEIKI